MALRLSIENVPSLPDGGPVSFSLSGGRSIDIGRDQHLDWTLPDPTRFISGKHCEIHWRDNSYWLHDVSTNGTFLYGSDQRVRSPHQLKDGDRLVIGHYIVAVAIGEDGRSPLQKGQVSAQAKSNQQHAAYPELWNMDRDAPPPVDRYQIRAPHEAARPLSPDFLDWAASVPEAEVRPARSRSPAPPVDPNPDMDWASGPTSRSNAPVERPSSLATPRRPIWKDEERIEPESNPFVGAQAKAGPQTQTVEVSPRRRLSIEPLPSAEADQVPTPRGSDPQADGQDFMHRVARAAALPEDFFDGKDTGQLAEQLGGLMRISVSNLMSLLQARNEAKRLTRSTTHTTIQATENNPLKFSPTAEDAMRILFGPKTHSYMEARKAFEQGFTDLKFHQLKTYAAMQHAVSMLVADFDPAEITKGVAEQEGTLDKLRSRKSRQWDAFVTRWKASLGREPGAAVEAFMLHFADYYDKDNR
ncbi:type VI secretion system-associated FHA domain protein TagH [Bradyrhizobium sp. AUGA SZCCT0182]|uniref:type VI secretion system-associated FHA domain protein TagH n=1 Tax=Bradyrhizobium sp. AUGA SZCCT0182 TaxID=2807667 RepID=UPI001BA8988A|nr:type VI secretion system-associated FHA domain protein TagH [Bradyrhizobium sp. AUGA SZCCT0182]MBR1232064.1 type VI secretion system-associated FHA domain protein TagH [Bradyrhizobium sp. AUGA SZCCT0182]